MDFFSDLVGAVQSDITVDASSTLFPPDTIKLAVNRAYTKIGGMYRWEETKDALKTSAEAGQEWYNYPDNWRAFSIFKLTVDGIDYGDPLLFEDYSYEIDNNFPSGVQSIWCNYGRKYFITPVPASDGDNNICVWGYKAVQSLVDDSDTTIFSYSIPEVNEAIVLEVDAILKQKGEIMQVIRRTYMSGPELLSVDAMTIVSSAWAKVTQEKSKLVRTTPAWNVPDYFPSGIRNRTALQNLKGQF